MFHKTIAHLVTAQRRWLWCAVALIGTSCLAILITRMALDTEVLNLLPRGFSSVEGLKIYNRDFAQTRELTFALLSDAKDVDRLEEFAPVFAEKLRKEPWCRRALAGSPMETPDGFRDLQSIALPLILNLGDAEFDDALSILRPEMIAERLYRLRQEIEAGSPAPRWSWNSIPWV